MKQSIRTTMRKAAAASALIALIFASATPALAAPEATVTASLTQTTGSAPFDDSDAPGNDSSGTNNIVRTNDTVTYRTDIKVGSHVANNTRLSLTLPRGEEAGSLPSFCLSTSVISPTMGEPQPDLTPESWKSLPAQTIDCDLGSLPSASSFSFPLISKIRPEVPHGTQLDPAFSTVTAGGVLATSNSVTHTVSAEGRYDASIGLSDKPNGALVTGPLHSSCAQDTEGCFLTKSMPILISAADSIKGNSALQSGFTMSIDLSAKAVYGTGITEAPAWKAAGATAEAKYRPSLPAAGPCLHDSSSTPHASIIGDRTAENSVRNSGTTTCTYDAATGILTMTVDGADTTGWTTPTSTATGSPLPANRRVLYSKAISLEVPYEAVKDLGVKSDAAGASNWALPQTIRISEITGKTLDGTAPNAASAKTWNNHKISSLTTGTPGDLDTFWSGVPGAVGNTPASDFNQSAVGFEGLPAQSSQAGGDGVLTKGSTGLVNVVTRWSSTGNTSRLTCQAWDNISLALAAANYPAGTGALMTEPSNGAAVWLTGSHKAGTATKVPATIKIEYGYNAAVANGAVTACSEASSTVGWKTSASDPVFNNDATQAASGVYTGVNRVRILTITTNPESTISNVAVALVNRGGKPAGATLPVYTGVKPAGKHTTTAAAAADPAIWTTSTYQPGATSEDPHSGSLGTRALSGTITAGVRTEFQSENGIWSPSPDHISKQEIKARITPVITAPVTTGVGQPVTAEVCLDAGLGYVAGSASIAPGKSEVVAAGKTAGTAITCTATQTYMSWNLGAKTPNKTIAPLTFTVTAKPATDGTEQSFQAVVTSDAEKSATGWAVVRVQSSAGAHLARVVTSDVIDINPSTGMTSPRILTWTTTLTGDATATLQDAVTIEALPRNGSGESRFDGALTFNTATVSAGGATAKIQYTNTQLSISDAGEASAATWHDTVASAGGQAKITGLRLSRPGLFAPGEKLSMNVTMTPSENSSDNIYESRSAAQAVGLPSAAGPLVGRTQVIESSIGGRLWIDADKSGKQDAGEVGYSGHSIKLTGKDTRDNTVTSTTTTDSGGQYRFGRLPAGSYTLDFGASALLAKHLPLAAPSAGGSAPDRTTGLYSVTLAAAENRTNVNAGATATTALSVAITSDRSNGSYASPQDRINYTMTIINTGKHPFTDTQASATVANHLDVTGVTVSAGTAAQAANTVNWKGALAPGATTTVKFAGTVSAAAVEGEKITAAATGSGSWFGGTQQSTCGAACSISHTNTFPKLEVSTAVAHSQPADTRATVGEVLTYRAVVKNVGKVPVQNVKATIQTPVGNILRAEPPAVATLTSPSGSPLAPGAVVDFGTVTTKHTVTQDDVDYGRIVALTQAHASTSSGFATQSPAHNASTETPTISSLSMSAKVIDGNADGTAQPGEDLSYSFQVTNTGPTTVTKVVVLDGYLQGAGVRVTAGSGFDGALSPKETVTFHSTPNTVTSKNLTAGAVATAAVASGLTRKGAAIHSNTTELSMSTPSASGLDLVKRVEDMANHDGFGSIGESLVYTFTLTNNSKEDFHEVRMSDKMLDKAGVGVSAPPNFDGTLTPGNSVAFTSEHYKVNAADAAAGKIVNTATASALNAVNTLRTAQPSTVTTPASPLAVLIETGSGAGVDQSLPRALRVAAGVLLMLAGVIAITITRRRMRTS